ncbi:hypothetical protein [Burkholderia lata]|uniref:hypothetical protein n=1 Tax=Burkholderia lata (strain ATCC 17760 / DSM 23089 / LMG 22485 / NCIMB 9086 / R18194 / 383) TaxID=482957 RepID=UPI002431DB96|nr:hypothetical protein [Burkholderia lata]
MPPSRQRPIHGTTVDNGARNAASIAIRPRDAADDAASRCQWKDDQAFYEVALDDDIFVATQSGLRDPNGTGFGFGAFDAAGDLLGLAHTHCHHARWTTCLRWLSRAGAVSVSIA